MASYSCSSLLTSEGAVLENIVCRDSVLVERLLIHSLRRICNTWVNKIDNQSPAGKTVCAPVFGKILIEVWKRDSELDSTGIGVTAAIDLGYDDALHVASNKKTYALVPRTRSALSDGGAEQLTRKVYYLVKGCDYSLGQWVESSRCDDSRSQSRGSRSRKGIPFLVPQEYNPGHRITIPSRV